MGDRRYSRSEYYGVYGYDRRAGLCVYSQRRRSRRVSDRKVLEDPEIVVSGVEDEGERNAWEYYVNLVHAMDELPEISYAPWRKKRADCNLCSTAIIFRR